MCSMLSDEQRKELKLALEREFVAIRTKAMAAFDAECICLCAELDKLWRGRNMESLGSDLRNFKKQVSIDLDLHAVEILSALRRISEGTYGRCVECAEDLRYGDLRVNPALQFCEKCRVEREVVHRN
jgi:RNA polymerase-binding transcription factor DksA